MANQSEELAKHLLLVDEHGNPLTGSGDKLLTADRLKCHSNAHAQRHRAFTCLVLDERCRILVGQRFPANNYLWKGIMDASFASHPYESDGWDNIKAAIRHAPSELNCEISDVKKIGAFDYREKDPEGLGIEHEFCDILAARLRSHNRVRPDRADPRKIGDSMWMDLETLYRDALGPEAEYYSPWLKIALKDIAAHRRLLWAKMTGAKNAFSV